MYRYRWLLAAAFAASAVIFGVAYNPSAIPAPPRAVPSFNVAHRYVTAAVRDLQSGNALSYRLGAVGSLGLPRARAGTNLSRQATLRRSLSSVTAALRRASAQG